MADITTEIQQLFFSFSGKKISSIQKLPKSGSDRQYFRLEADADTGSQINKSFIATFNPNVKENEAFITWAKHFHEKKLAVPVIYAVSHDKTTYIQEDLGNHSLLDARLKGKESNEVFELYKKSLKALARLQVNGDEGLDYSLAPGSGNFGRQAVLHDLLYFKFYFLDALKVQYDRELLLLEFEQIATRLSSSAYAYFMFRDFQGRNIMVRNDDVYFIDFQGGMKGPLVYDAASLLWQAKAGLSNEWRNALFEYYMNCVDEVTGKKLNRDVFKEEYQGFVLLRLLQVLGAYGFRGLIERKQHFISSIPQGLTNLTDFQDQFSFASPFTELSKVIKLLSDPGISERYRPVQSGQDSPLLVKINSFSFIQRGYPADTSGNGGGFVFDCRGIMNPGRIDEFKPLTGRDESVRLYLEEKTRMPEFLSTVFESVDIAVENYIDRGFESLTVSFGCTGGRHRSVYAADALAKHLQEKYKVRTEVRHLEQDFKD